MPDKPTIWIDADACPAVVKDLVFRASDRLSLTVVLVADRPLKLPNRRLISQVVVRRDLDAADKHIVDQVAPGDLVVTADLPLAAQVVEKGAQAINPRGEVYDADTVGERLSMRDFFMGLRDAGQDLGGPPPFGPKDKQRFAASLDRFLSRAGL